MSDKTGYFQYFCGLYAMNNYFLDICMAEREEKTNKNIESCIETHWKVSLIVLIEYMEETLLENGSSEGIR